MCAHVVPRHDDVIHSKRCQYHGNVHDCGANANEDAALPRDRDRDCDRARSRAMTTAHRPTWAPAKGREHQGGARLFGPSAKVSKLEANGFLTLKTRARGQSAADELLERDFARELAEKEREAAKKASGGGVGGDMKALGGAEGDAGAGAFGRFAPRDEDADDDDDDDGGGDGASDGESESDSDSESDGTYFRLVLLILGVEDARAVKRMREPRLTVSYLCRRRYRGVTRRTRTHQSRACERSRRESRGGASGRGTRARG